MAKMIIMRGLPASGKSTKAKEYVSQGNTVRINKDLMRTMLHFDKFSGYNEGLTREAVRLLARHFLLGGKNVIIDDTNLNVGTLQSWVDLAKDVDAKIEHCDLDVSVDECLNRDAQRENKVGSHVIKQMAIQYFDYWKGEDVIICDLDGTLCDVSHRRHFVEGEKKDWKGFFSGIAGDTLRYDVFQKVKEDTFFFNAKLILVSARPSNYRKDTEEWLAKNASALKYELLIMRGDRDGRPDTEVKAEIFDKYLSKMNVIRVYDDRPSVIRMWKEKGLSVEDVVNGIEF
jgi:predicted kinase